MDRWEKDRHSADADRFVEERGYEECETCARDAWANYVAAFVRGVDGAAWAYQDRPIPCSHLGV